VVLLVTAAFGVLLFMVLAGAMVYGNTRQLIASAESVGHTQEVLNSLQRFSVLSERIDYRSRLYLLTGNEEQLLRARASTNQLDNLLVHLSELVSDNPVQVDSVKGLTACSVDIHKIIDGFTSKSAPPEDPVARCQQVVGLMSDREQRLLQERTKGSARSSLLSVGTEVGFVTISGAMMVVLFGLLLRDALSRQRIGTETRIANEQLARSVSALEDRALESELLTAARDELQLCVDVQQVYQSAANSCSRLLTGTGGALCIINNSRQLVEVVSMWRESAVVDFHLAESCCSLRSGQPRWRKPGVSEIHCTHFSGDSPERYLCVPIVANGNTLGLLYIECLTAAAEESVIQSMDGVRQLVQLTGMAIATLNLRTKLENQSIRDSLTGLFNRHFMEISLEREIARAARNNRMLAVFMLDLDHFKTFNDTYGHAAGDAVLSAVAEIFRNSIRTEDIACRYGGEEFTIMLPDVTPKVAYERAERVRQAVESLRVPLERDVYGELTVSIGLAIYPHDGEAGDQLLRRADQALYRAKRSGRNRVEQYEDATLQLSATQRQV